MNSFSNSNEVNVRMVVHNYIEGMHVWGPLPAEKAMFGKLSKCKKWEHVPDKTVKHCQSYILKKSKKYNTIKSLKAFYKRINDFEFDKVRNEFKTKNFAPLQQEIDTIYNLLNSIS